MESLFCPYPGFPSGRKVVVLHCQMSQTAASALAMSLISLTKVVFPLKGGKKAHIDNPLYFLQWEEGALLMIYDSVLINEAEILNSLWEMARCHPLFASASKVCHLQCQCWCLRVQYLIRTLLSNPRIFIFYIAACCILQWNICLLQRVPGSSLVRSHGPAEAPVVRDLHALERCGESKAEAWGQTERKR